MPFNTDKCKVMHLGHNNNKIEYEMGGMKLDSNLEEKDLGVIFILMRNYVEFVRLTNIRG